MSPQQVLAADPSFLQCSLGRLIKPRVLLMLHKEHASCYNCPGASLPMTMPYIPSILQMIHDAMRCLLVLLFLAI